MCLERERHLVSNPGTARARSAAGGREAGRGGPSGGSYRHRRARDRCGLCHSGHGPCQRGGHRCRDGTGTGDVHAVALGVLHLSLVAGRRRGVCGGQAESGVTGPSPAGFPPSSASRGHHRPEDPPRLVNRAPRNQTEGLSLGPGPRRARVPGWLRPPTLVGTHVGGDSGGRVRGACLVGLTGRVGAHPLRRERSQQ